MRRLLDVLAIVLILAGALLGPVVATILVLVWAQLSRTPLPAIGLTRAPNWPATIVGGIALGVALKLLLKTIVMPLAGAPATNGASHYLVANTAALPGIVATVLISAGIGEEVFYRGYIVERVRTVLGARSGSVIAAILISTVLFAAAHYGTRDSRAWRRRSSPVPAWAVSTHGASSSGSS